MNQFETTLREAITVFESLHRHREAVEMAAHWCVEALASQNKLLICGNGGSSAEAQHLAGELMGRYKRDRRALAALALSSDNAVLTCIGNDYSFNDVFARQVEGLGKPGDILVVFSTSGNSPNILAALRAASHSGIRSIAFLGGHGGQAKALATSPIIVNHSDTARVQEAHQFLMHCMMDYIEARMEDAVFAGKQTLRT
jgi:D-sedoheptulose 7-phosphate isomerase